MRLRFGMTARIAVLAVLLTMAIVILASAWSADPSLAAPPSSRESMSPAFFAPPQSLMASSRGSIQDEFGYAVAVSGDTAVVGAAGANDGVSKAYVCVRRAGLWSRQAKLSLPGDTGHDGFGYAVAISDDTIVIGAASVNGHGSAYVYVRTGTKWTMQKKLTPSDSQEGDFFGHSVAISGDTIVVGAANDKVGEDWQQGAAYVFTRTGTTWSEQQKLVASDGAEGDYFGFAVALSGDTVVVGASDGSSGGNAAYVFTRTGTTWSEQQKLTSADGYGFGSSVAVSADTAVIGASQTDNGRGLAWGAAYVFSRTGSTWSEQQKLTVARINGGELFGLAVGVSGDTAVIGTEVRSAFVFTRVGSTWSQQRKLAGPRTNGGLDFGQAVAIADDTVLVGSYGDWIGANWDQGSVYIYIRGATSWSLQARVSSSGLLAKPAISRLTPSRGRVGAIVTIIGSGFGAKRGTSKVYFSRKAAAKYYYWSKTRIRVQVPSVSTGSKAVKVKTVGGASNTASFVRT